MDIIKNQKRIGISGGTFDPIHNGHLAAAEEIRKKFQLDRIIFIPVGMPPHKSDHKVTDARHRYNMVLEAVSANPFFEASSIEADRDGYTYTVDTLQCLKTLYGEDSRLFFIIGADVVPELVTWRQFESVFKLCDFIAVNRPGNDNEVFLKEIKYLKDRYSASIYPVRIPPVDISSTDIRSRVKSGKTIKGLVPEVVEKYIYINDLYL